VANAGYHRGMTDGWTHTATYALALALGVVIGCAGKGKGSKSPEDCLRQCDQDHCQFVADSVGDNAEYLECLQACEAKCSK
jgi:hypothetical protein